jgi:RNA polymerase sporulation-specific sigma factor
MGEIGKINLKDRSFYEKQNEQLIILVQKVREDGDELAFEQIKKKLNGYINSITKKFFISGFTNDDIIQECLIALRFKAIDDYDSKKGPFIKFAKLCIRRHIITELKACKKKKNFALNSAMSLDQEYEGEDSACSLLDIIPDTVDENHFIKVNLRERGRFLYNSLSRKLTELEYKILVYYIKGYNYMEIVNLLRGEGLLEAEDKKDKKVIDNGLCRIKTKALSLKQKIDEERKLQGDMFMDLSEEIR